MNLLIKRPTLFVLLLISLFSCKDSADLNSVFEGNLINAVYTDTVSIKAATVIAKDSIIGYQRGNLLAGTFFNEKFGLTEASSYLALGPNGGTLAANNGNPDSVVLVLDYDEYYGDTTKNYSVEVHELTKAFAEDKTYYTNNNNDLTYSPDVLGSVTFVPKPKRTNSKTASSGTVTKTSIPVRIKLNNDLGKRIMALPSATLSNTIEFAKSFKGIVLTPGTNTNSVLGFAPNSDSTYFRIYYTATDGKRQKYDLPISGDINARFNQISNDLSDSKLASLKKTGDSIASSAVEGETYLQESTGIVTKITFPYLDQFREKLNVNDVAVNRAELIIPVKDNPDYLPSPAAYLVETNKSNVILKSNRLPRVIIEDPLETRARGGNPPRDSQAAAVRYDKDKKAYIINITKYVQDVIYRKKTANGQEMSNSLLLVPTSRTGVLDATGKTVLETTGLNQSVLQISGSKKIKLQLYFSKSN